MKVIKKLKDGMTTFITKDDNGNLIKMEMIDDETKESFISEYEYDDKNRVIRYSNNKAGFVQYEYDDKDRIIWKREQISRFTNAYHYMYKEDENIVMGEEVMYGHGGLLIVHCSLNEGLYHFDIETDKIDNIKDVLEYCTTNEISISQPVDYSSYSMIFRFYIETIDKEQYIHIRELFNIEEVR